MISCNHPKTHIHLNFYVYFLFQFQSIVYVYVCMLLYCTGVVIVLVVVLSSGVLTWHFSKVAYFSSMVATTKHHRQQQQQQQGLQAPPQCDGKPLGTKRERSGPISTNKRSTIRDANISSVYQNKNIQPEIKESPTLELSLAFQNYVNATCF